MLATLLLVAVGIFGGDRDFAKTIPDISLVSGYACEINRVAFVDHKKPILEKGIRFETRFVLIDEDGNEIWSYRYSYRKKYSKALKDCLPFYEELFDKVEEWEKKN